MKTYAWVIVGVIVLVIGGIIWKNFSGPSASDSAVSTSGSSNNVQPSTGSATTAPDFSLTSLTGTTIHLADYRGKKPVILDFWATWCPNCRRDMPRLNELYNKYKDKVEVIGVDLQEDKGTVSDFITSRGINFPIVIDQGDVANQYSARYTNTHVLVKKDGTVLQVIPGDIDENVFQSLLL